MSEPEVWLRGPVPGVAPALQPVAHALLQAREEVTQVLHDASTAELWASFGGSATIAFHVRHMCGSLDRLLTYARGEPLSPAQRDELSAEGSHAPAVKAAALLESVGHRVDAALDQLRSTPPDTLDEARAVGRAGLPSTVRGLLHHAGEHTARHAAQAITTLRLMRGVAREGGAPGAAGTAATT